MNFSEYFKISNKENLEFIDINLYGDFPFFIDPLLLKGEENLPGAYDKFLKYFKNRDLSYQFKEVKQTHLGFGNEGFSGHGIGPKLAKSIKNNTFLTTHNVDGDLIEIFQTGIGKDRISDMTTNIIISDLAMFTETQCKKYCIDTKKVAIVNEKGVREFYNLPVYNDDYILLVPKYIVRKGTMLLSITTLTQNILDIVDVISDNQLKNKLNSLIMEERYDEEKKKYVRKKVPNSIIKTSLPSFIESHPEFLTDFKKYVEKNIKTTDISDTVIEDYSNAIDSSFEFIEHLKRESLNLDDSELNTYIWGLINTYKKHIENSNFIKIFKVKENQNEKNHQNFFKLLFLNSSYQILSEVDNGNGPCDFLGTDGDVSIIIEFKLARSNKINNIYKQINEYKKVNKKVIACYAVIFTYNDKELEKAQKIKLTNLDNTIKTIIVDCNYEKYLSGSNVK